MGYSRLCKVLLHSARKDSKKFVDMQIKVASEVFFC